MNTINNFLKTNLFLEQVSDSPDIDNTISKNHKLVNKKIQVNEYATGELKKYIGKLCKIISVILRNEKIIGFKIKTNDNIELYAPKKYFYLHYQFVEDISPINKETNQVLDSIHHWNSQHDYYGTSWKGLERLLINMSSVIVKVAVEATKWYKYPSSTRHKMDGKNWRYIFKSKNDYGVINCHSLLHDGVWTLSTTTYSTDEIDESKLIFIYDEDLWIRVCKWIIATAKLLQQSNYDYSNVIMEYSKKLKYAKQLNRIIKEKQQLVAQTYSNITNKNTKFDEEAISIAISECLLPVGKIGNYLSSDSYHSSILSIHPNLINNKEQLNTVMIHELIHGILGTDCTKESHSSELFKKMLTALSSNEVNNG